MEAHGTATPVRAERDVVLRQDDLHARRKGGSVLSQFGVFELDDIDAVDVDDVLERPPRFVGGEELRSGGHLTEHVGALPRMPPVERHAAAVRSERVALLVVALGATEDQKVQVHVPVNPADEVEQPSASSVVGRPDVVWRDDEDPRSAPLWAVVRFGLGRDRKRHRAASGEKANRDGEPQVEPSECLRRPHAQADHQPGETEDPEGGPPKRLEGPQRQADHAPSETANRDRPHPEAPHLGAVDLGELVQRVLEFAVVAIPFVAQ
jgi:hypothetical protein